MEEAQLRRRAPSKGRILFLDTKEARHMPSMMQCRSFIAARRWASTSGGLGAGRRRARKAQREQKAGRRRRHFHRRPRRPQVESFGTR